MTGPSPVHHRPPSPRPASAGPSPRGQAFSQFVAEQQASREEARQRAAQVLEEQLAQTCTFRPAINPSPSGRRHTGALRDPFLRLSQHKSDTDQKLEEERLRQQEKELLECSFCPKTNPSQTTHRPPSRGPRGAPLHRPPPERQLLIERRREEEEEEARGWFKPQLNAMSRATAEAEPRAPLHERLEDLRRQRQVLLHQLRLEKTQQEAATFRPCLNPTSEEIVQLQQQAASSTSETSSGSPYKEQLMQRSQSRAKLEEEAGRRHSAECPFRPALDRKSEAIVQQHAAFKAQGFQDRQLLFARRSKSKLLTAMQKTEADAAAAFRPALSPTSVLLTQAKRDAETAAEKVERLAKRDKALSEEARRIAAEQYYAQYPFQPKVNKMSRDLVSNMDTADVTRAKTGHVTEELRQELEEAFRQTCTFRPAICSGSERLGPDSSSVTVADPAAKERHRAEARREKQYEELKECTFQPQLTRPPRARRASDVPGLAKFLERRDQARRLEEERRQREEQAFKVKGPPAEGHRYTVPQPFNLHDYHSAARKESVQASLRAKTQQDCPFAPATNSKAAYEILRKYIMQDDSASESEELDTRPHAAMT